LIDDTYNASPASVKAAIDVLVNHAGRKFLVLGDMAELGEASLSLHAEVGSYARKYGVNRLLACGNDSRAAVESFGCGGDHFASKGELADFLGQELEEGDVVLVKGSRSSAMEVVVNMLKRKVVA
jgi:UDP-N-acetylmuramoyl-tripeptide--D-alanyl-D-alanine ligase